MTGWFAYDVRMPSAAKSSRLRYRDYRRRVREKKNETDPTIPYSSHRDDKKKPRSRPFGTLLAKFWDMLRGYRTTLAFVLLHPPPSLPSSA